MKRTTKLSKRTKGSSNARRLFKKVPAHWGKEDLTLHKKLDRIGDLLEEVVKWLKEPVTVSVPGNRIIQDSTGVGVNF